MSTRRKKAAPEAEKAPARPQDTRTPVVVIGDGWSALGAVGLLARSGASVRWVAGSGARVLPPLPTLEAADSRQGAPAWDRLARGFGLELGEAVQGSFLREFRNKAFREPAWTKAPTPETRKDVLAESLWAPELSIVPSFEARFGLTLAEVEEEIRRRLQQGGVERSEQLPVDSLRVEEGRVKAVVLGSGQAIECSHVLYADRWNLLPGIGGLPKGLAFARRREPMGLLQAVFTHEHPVGAALMEGFFGSLHKEAGETIERHVWGYFTSDGRRSVWSVCLSPEENEENHEIAKKLRRMKSALDRMFTGESWVPAGKESFMSNVSGEHIRFEEAILFAEGEPPTEPVTLSGLEGIHFLTDGYGPSSALSQAHLALVSIGALRPEGQAEGVNVVSPVPAEGMEGGSQGTAAGDEIVYQ